MTDAGKRFDTAFDQRGGGTVMTHERLLELSGGDYVYWKDTDGIVRFDLPLAVPKYALVQFTFPDLEASPKAIV